MRVITLATSAIALSFGTSAIAAGHVHKEDVLTTYANIAHANFEDSFIAAKRLQSAVNELVANPSAEALEAAKSAWLAARVPYQQSEVFRFGNAIVDDWEGKVNAWPLDEGLIDYVDASYGGATDENAAAVLNVIANPKFTLGGERVDASKITTDLLENTLQEADGVEANVATGYHAVELLLWGQDLNGHGAGAGSRPWSDYAAGAACSGGNCDRRGDYLVAATDLLVSDLEWITDQWAEGGNARAEVTADADAGVAAILTGMGSLSYGETAGERMRLGVMLNDPEEEHSCFSDNTHNDHFFNGVGVQSIYNGSYTRIDGTVVEGASLSDLVAHKDADLEAEMQAKLSAAVFALGKIKTAAEAGFSYDMMLEKGNAAGEALIMGGVNGLVDQTRSLERVVALLGTDIEVEGSDSLDNPSAVFE